MGESNEASAVCTCRITGICSHHIHCSDDVCRTSDDKDHETSEAAECNRLHSGRNCNGTLLYGSDSTGDHWGNGFSVGYCAGFYCLQHRQIFPFFRIKEKWLESHNHHGTGIHFCVRLRVRCCIWCAAAGPCVFHRTGCTCLCHSSGIHDHDDPPDQSQRRFC